MVPSFGDVRKTILFNEMLGKATERVIEMFCGDVEEFVPPLGVELVVVVVGTTVVVVDEEEVVIVGP